ncbi:MULTISPECIES: type II secretion system protein [unclassified Sporosarcina]|uniref:type II secretion system protein n=1 Tax=unclassified Sporosarcina TaxID=2647733 RepID=UPI000C16A2A1|nr:MULTISPECIES: prepilin-type N-terminal cleavage/methylation domain-containing protein [unclassified Sporosarcina]PID07338.1 Tfp assembly type protein [Sporosarcina sp. P30]PID10534.1 Tfp assembly type protein [Sporosarcina sp. P31]PID13119.1 Tfp assembly type protein [Sporosarcina sp. P32b]
MKKFMQKKLNQKGLTLVELLAVIVILGIIAAIAVPAIGNIITNSKVNALKGDGQNVLSAAQLYFTENGSKDTATVTTDILKTDGFLEDVGGFTKGTGAVVTKNADGNTISGMSKAKGVSVEFKAATNKNINDAPVKVGNDQVVVNRNAGE